MSPSSSGFLTLSLDLELEISRATPDQLRWLDQVTPELVALLDTHAIAATWAVADPGRSAATEAILNSRQKHELAVLGDRSWLGWGAGGSRASRELARRINGAAARQIRVRSLVLHNEASFALDLPLQELGIQILRQPVGHEVIQPVALASLSPDLLVAEQVQRLSVPGWWSWDWESHLLARCRRLGRLGGQFSGHLGLDAEQLCAGGPRGFQRWVQVVEALARLRDRHQLTIQTLAQWGERGSGRLTRVA